MKSLKEIRESRGVKQSAVADYLGISRQTLSRYENNTEEVPLAVAEKICLFLHFPVEEIFLPGNVSNTNISTDD